jgi:uncharacterized membrane protein YfcA
MIIGRPKDRGRQDHGMAPSFRAPHAHVRGRHLAQGGASATAAERTADAARPPLRFARDLGTGLLVGALTGCFGVGGGFPIVQTLGFLALSMRQVA